MIRISFAFVLFFMVVSCKDNTKLSPEDVKSYEKEINEWHAKRIENLKAPNGWLNIVGLYWLEPGINSFGSGTTNKVIFPKAKIAEDAGYFLLTGDKVEIFVNKKVVITSGKDTIQRKVVFLPDSISPILKSNSLRWNIIKRDDKIGIRLRDDETEAITGFEGIERYAIDPTYRVQAAFIKHDTLRTINITNMLGQTTAQRSPGALTFIIKGKTVQLDVLEGGKDEFFVIFADDTSGKETYQGGRFIYVKHPDTEGNVIIDFNKAYNPPCVFTPHATCPLPPQQNILPVSITAGEKVYHQGETI